MICRRRHFCSKSPVSGDISRKLSSPDKHRFLNVCAPFIWHQTNLTNPIFGLPSTKPSRNPKSLADRDDLIPDFHEPNPEYIGSTLPVFPREPHVPLLLPDPTPPLITRPTRACWQAHYLKRAEDHRPVGHLFFGAVPRFCRV